MLAFFLAVLETETERQQFTALYEQYHDRMEQIALNILGEQHDAEDAVQNSFLQIIRHFEKISEISCEELPFWLISIVKNEALMLLRKRDRTATLKEERFPGGAEDVSDYTALVELFRSLPDTDRRVLEMKVLLGYTDKEIAGHLGITETAVSTRASRGRQLLREILEKEGFQL